MKSTIKTNHALCGLISGLAFAAALASSVTTAKANLILDGSFETPVIAPATFQSFNIGSTIGPWTVVGTGANPAISIVASSYTAEAPLSFLAEDGNQSLDLSGPCAQGHNGVSQVAATTLGTSYSLSFWVGNQYNGNALYTLPSSVELQVNGISVQTFSNNDNTLNALNWKQFNYQFTAAGAATTIAFFNATPVGDHMAGLDNVDLQVVPEPSSALLLLGSGAMLLLRRRRTAV